jgi:hypothetical protein
MFGLFENKSKKMANAISALVDDTLASSESKKKFIQSVILHNGIPSTFDTMEICIRAEISERMRTIGIEADHGSENYVMVVSAANNIVSNSRAEIQRELTRSWLADNITKTHKSQHGVFNDAYQDMVSVYKTQYANYSDFYKEAYAFSRIELVSVLFLQGVINAKDLQLEMELFPGFHQIVKRDGLQQDKSSKSEAFWFLMSYLHYEFEDHELYYDMARSVLRHVLNGEINEEMVGTTCRSPLMVMKLLDALHDLSIGEDNFNPKDHCDARGIYESVLGE